MGGSFEQVVEATKTQIAGFAKLLPRAIIKLPPAVRFRSENAINGFARAKALLPVDREMASFRAITAGEEAASALIRSLQLRGYEGADLIDLKRHSHKAAVPFFLAAIQYELSRNGNISLTVSLSVDPPKLTVALPLAQFVILPNDMDNLHLELVDPLGFVSKNGDIDAANYFDDAVKTVAGSRKVDKLIAAEANGRNRLLYAHDNGIPKSQVTLHSIESRERNGILCVLLAIAVLQVEHQQDFARQSLGGYLKVIGRTAAE
jgi:hypothetical protein